MKSDSSTRAGRHHEPNPLPWGRILLVLVLLGGVAAYFGARPAWRRVKAFRAERFIAEAKEHFRTENWAAGMERTRAALQLAPAHPAVLRHAAYTYSQFGSEAAFRYFEPLLASPAGTREDREESASLALRVGNLESARQQIDDLLESATPSARSLVLGAQLAVARRDLPTALRLARNAAAVEPSNPTNHLMVASVLAASKTPAEQREARDVLWPFAKGAGPLQIQALAALLGMEESSREDREEVERILTAMKPRSEVAELLLAETRISLDPSARERTAEEILEKLGRGTPQQMITAARWFNRNRFYHRTRDLVLPDLAAKEPTLFRLRYDALVGLGDLRGAYELLLTDKPPGSPVATEFLRCETALRLKDSAAVDSHYRNLLALSQKDPRALRSLAEFAMARGNRDVANEALQALARNPRDAVAALRGLVRNADATGETWTARDYARRLADLRKDDDGVRLQVVYYDLLLKENLDQAAAAANELHLAKPEDFNRRAVLALAHLRRREPAKALTLIASETPDTRKVPAGIRAVAAAVFAAGGRPDGASNVLRYIQISRLKPEERELIKPLLSTLPKENAALGDTPPEPARGKRVR